MFVGIDARLALFEDGNLKGKDPHVLQFWQVKHDHLRVGQACDMPSFDIIECFLSHFNDNN